MRSNEKENIQSALLYKYSSRTDYCIIYAENVGKTWRNRDGDTKLSNFN